MVKQARHMIASGELGRSQGSSGISTGWLTEKLEDEGKNRQHGDPILPKPAAGA